MTDFIGDKEKNKIIESRVIEWITREAGERLTVFKPVGIKGADLVVKRRGEYPGKAIYLKINGSDNLGENGIFIKDVLKETLRPEENLYLIFVYFNEVLQDIADYIWLLPSLEFRDIAEFLVLEKEEVLKFEAPLNPKKKNKYSRFLTSKKNIAQILLKILTLKKFEFTENGAGKAQIINLEELKKFIAEARKNTYAGDGVPVDNPRLISSKQLEYQKSDYFYRDIYFTGGKNFIGQEMVYQNNLPIWGMVYLGLIEPKEASRFLKNSLLALSEECRFGGKCQFKDDEFRYEDKGTGETTKFEGEERIFMKEKEVYNLKYLGGLISK